jgi:hypothetical protein
MRLSYFHCALQAGADQANLQLLICSQVSCLMNGTAKTSSKYFVFRLFQQYAVLYFSVSFTVLYILSIESKLIKRASYYALPFSRWTRLLECLPFRTVETLFPCEDMFRLVKFRTLIRALLIFSDSY